MTRRSIGNRQKKVVAPRAVRGGERPLHPTPPRPAPGRRERPRVPPPSDHVRPDSEDR